MFTTLMESRAPKARRVGGTLISALLHGFLVTSAVMLTLPRPVDATPKPKEPTHVTWTYPRPPLPVARTGGATTVNPRENMRLPFVDIHLPDVPTISVNVEPVIEPTAGEVNPNHGGVGAAAPFGGGIPGGIGSGGTWDANQVDRAPAVAGRAVEPRYPSQLRAAGVEGRAVLQFVVDTLGRAEMSDVAVMETTHPQFAEAAREALPRFHFVPGEASGRKVRTRVQIPFNFTINR
jgi:protein TonB